MQLAEARAQVLGQRRRRREAGVGTDDAELVAAEPRREVAGPHPLAQNLGDRLEDAVAAGVAVAVVDLLQVVEITEQQRQPAVLAARTLELARQGLVPRAPVGQPGERVLAAEPLEPAEQFAVAL